MINNTKLQNHGNEKRNYEPNCMKHIQRVVYSFADNIVYYIDCNISVHISLVFKSSYMNHKIVCDCIYSSITSFGR